MNSRWRTFAKPRSRAAHRMRLFAPLVALLSLALLAACHDTTEPVAGLSIAAISVNGGAQIIERGSDPLLTATVRNSAGDTLAVPVVWRSSVETVASFDRDGRLVTHDTGLTVVTASALGVTSQPVQVRVVIQGAASIAPFQFQPPASISPGGTIGDSIRALVTNVAGGAATEATVRFTVTEGGGTISPRIVTVGPSGLAAAEWIAGPATGRNAATATVIGRDSQPITFVRGNPARFTATSYAALAIVRGDLQTGRVLSPLPVSPAVRLVDTAGRARPGIPVTFRPSANGRVDNGTVSTGADGVASPGTWTLGDQPGDEQLVVTVEGARILLHATATGSVTRFTASAIATAQAATCGVGADRLARCLGQWPQNGSGDTPANRATPTPTKGDVTFTTLAGGGAHFCGIDLTQSIYCWGVNALADTSGAVVSNGSPRRLGSALPWQQVAPGGQHNCGLTTDQVAYCWGSNADGQLGDNGSTSRFVPAPVAGGFRFSQLTSGGAHSCGVTSDGSAFCWGANASGQLGDGTQTSRRAPTAVSGATQWRTLAAGTATTCGLALDGTAYCWGASTGRVVPGGYPGAPAFASITVGGAHQCALTAAGVAYCWGDNGVGQLGDGTTTSHAAPAPVSTSLRFASISAGAQHSCGLTTDGFVACWGRDQAGELGVDTPVVQTTPRFVVVGTSP